MEDSRKLLHQGAEAKLYSGEFLGKKVIIKERFPKKYRHPSLDQLLSKERTKTEAKYLMKCRYIGICTPAIYYIDEETNSIYMDHITDGITVRNWIEELQQTKNLTDLHDLAAAVGRVLGKMHANNIIHGDLTTSNMLLRRNAPFESKNIILIDFGLSHTSSTPEDKGVDLYVLERAVLSTHSNSDDILQILLQNYNEINNDESQLVLKKLDEIRMRGRKRTMIG